MKQTPLMRYDYYPWRVKNYDDWARQAADLGGGMIEFERATHLEQLYSDEKIYTAKDHEKNIQWLRDLEYELEHVWTFRQRSVARMESLVDDYKQYVGIT
ncbi:hypothetical protein M5X11_20100 [Paenibacillus alginolyticus]|uniref:Uncharacterized protein n=1 Tax=Paenibacillus alginolyticus TaxID=59839 RepID=A0ABT4G8I5_9BACL|nr:hypothetical protein [Paenibacillus alginolyticus]MCY9667208.1 hypothetical protein [Paenibacillus alginolyticus]MCY9692490.1 hypothetical protein [Paenibacillus alginolyticus]MEC0144283.1 hypothetical protein [Paenibacillus alginolyticus]